MRTALLRAAAVLIVAATPAVAQRAALPHLPAQPQPARSIMSQSSQSVPSRALRGAVNDRVLAPNIVSPAIDPSRAGLFKLGPGDSVGYTYYDLQTNAAMTDRIINWPNDAMPLGAVRSTVVWTASVDNPPKNGGYAATTRGTYGAVHDGQSWQPMRGSWTRIEEDRTGFVELDRLSDGRTVFASHSADNVKVWIELSPGSNEYFPQDIPGSALGLWPSITVSDNDDIHVIWTYTVDDVNPDEIENEIFYSHSLDDGAFSQAVQLTGSNSVISPNLRGGFGANSYAIASKGDNVAIWFLTSSIELMQLRSRDRGTSWPAETAVFLFDPTNTRRYHTSDDPEQQMWPDPTFGADTAIGFRSDTVPGPGSALDLMMDADGYTHGVVAIYPTYVTRYYSPGGDSTESTFTRGIIHMSQHAYSDAGLVYLRERDNQYISVAIDQPGGVGTSGEAVAYMNRRFYHGGYSIYPQLGMDASRNVYLTFTSGIAGDTQLEKEHRDSTARNWLNHHVFVTWMRSDDEQRRWMAPRDLTPRGLDAKFASLADLVDDELHIAYQIDPEVADMITDTLAPISRERNNIEVLMLAQSALTNPASADDGAVHVSAMSVAPNPSRGDARLTLSISQPGRVTAHIVDAMGRTVATIADGEMAAGTHVRSISTRELATGVYYIVARSGQTVTTSTLEVVH